MHRFLVVVISRAFRKSTCFASNEKARKVHTNWGGSDVVRERSREKPCFRLDCTLTVT